LLGLVGLILAFSLSLAVGRYQDRRADVVTDANTIGPAHLRAQTLSEPQRSRSLALLRRYNDLAIRLTCEIPGRASLRATAAEQGRLQQMLWRLEGEAINARPRDSAPRLYIDSLNAMIDQQGVRLAGLNTTHPMRCSCSICSSVLGRGLLPVVLAVVVVSFLVLFTFDLDRPTRGLIEIPAAPLLAEKATMTCRPRRPLLKRTGLSGGSMGEAPFRGSIRSRCETSSDSE
jgi:hypothetical protein